MSDNVHGGHRQRVRNRFLKDGNLDSFEYHQILEFLLFFTIPRRDTNVLAHKMLEEYGSFYNLLESRPEDIVKRCKVPETTAILLSMLPHLFRRYLNSRWDRNVKIDCVKIAYEYLKARLIGQYYESFFMLCLDGQKRLNNVVKISDGNLNQSHIYVDRVVEKALLYKSIFVVVGHNHPSGNMKPSAQDVKATEKIRDALKSINVLLVDHIIVCDDNYYSFAEKQLCNLRYE